MLELPLKLGQLVYSPTSILPLTDEGGSLDDCICTYVAVAPNMVAMCTRAMTEHEIEDSMGFRDATYFHVGERHFATKTEAIKAVIHEARDDCQRLSTALKIIERMLAAGALERMETGN